MKKNEHKIFSDIRPTFENDMNRVLINFYLRTKTVYMTLSVNSLRTPQFSTGIRCRNPRNWNQDLQRFSGDDASRNIEIEMWEIKARNIWVAWQLSETPFTAITLRDELLKKQAPPTTLIQAFEAFTQNSEKKTDLAPRTKQTHRTRLNLLAEYLKETQAVGTLLENLSVADCLKFQEWLTAKGYETSYVNKNMKQLQSVLRWCVATGRATKNVMEYWRYLKEPKKQKVYLSTAQVRLLMATKMPNQTLEKTKDIFLFQCHTGLCYADLKNFNTDNLKSFNGNEWIEGRRQKTESTYMVPLMGPAKRILEKYDHSLPVMSNAKFNAYLKMVGELCGFDLPLTTHAGRKTFGNLCIENGCPLQTVSEMMGHKDSRLTAKTYTDVHKSKIMLDMRRVLREVG